MEIDRQAGAAETRARPLIAVLRGIRHVSQLIVAENDPGRLIERACESLTATIGYHNAWIALLGGEAGRALGLADRGVVSATAAAGFDGGFGAMRERLERGEFAACMGRALETGETLITGDPATDCPDCPLPGDYSGCAGMTRRLDFDGVSYGILAASVPADYARDSEEQELFDELAGALAFGLHRIATARRMQNHERRIALLGHMLDEAPAAITIHDTDGNFLFSNRQNMRLHGYDSEAEFIAVKLHALDIPASAELIEERMRIIAERGEACFEVAHRRKDGSTFPLEVLAKRIEWAGQPALLSIATDITERKRAAQLLLSERDRFQAVLETAPVALLISDHQERIVQANRAATALFGPIGDVTSEPLRCGDFLGCVHRSESAEGCGHSASCSNCEVYRALRLALAGQASNDLETEIHVERGGATEIRIILLNAAPLRTGERLGAILAANDITEMRAMHTQMAQADQLSSMGMLAAGVAHEINNPLSYVLYNLESLTKDIPGLIRAVREFQLQRESSDPRGAALAQAANPALLEDMLAQFRDALEGTHRIRDIARGLGTISRVEKEQIVPVNLMPVIEVATSMAFNEIKYRARLVKDYGRTPTVLASEGRLSQVFLNLVINATHAIDEGDVENNAIRLRTWSEDDIVYAEVRDTGSGIAPEHLDKLFEPFFSTKKLGQGSGLGLTISKSIIESYGGSISVESELGKGTAFVVRLPARAEATDDLEDVARADDETSIRGRILIVDDEGGIRAAMARMLREHETVQAASGAEAKRLIQKDQAFDLILCDMMMPDLSGMDLHRWLLDANPDLARQLVFITGGAFTPHARDYLNKVDNLRMEKPFDLANFKKIVNELILAHRTKSRLDEPKP